MTLIFILKIALVAVIVLAAIWVYKKYIKK